MSDVSPGLGRRPADDEHPGTAGRPPVAAPAAPDPEVAGPGPAPAGSGWDPPTPTSAPAAVPAVTPAAPPAPSFAPAPANPDASATPAGPAGDGTAPGKRAPMPAPMPAFLAPEPPPAAPPAATPPAEAPAAPAPTPHAADGEPAPRPARAASGATAYRESLVRDALARVASPYSSRPGVSRETSPSEVSRETTKEVLGAFSGEDTPIAAAAAAALRVARGFDDQPFPRPARRRVMTVANQKGGVGKTTSTVNIATALALRGLRVLCIDLDPQGNASTGLGIPHQAGTASIYDVLIGDAGLDDVIQAAPIPGLWCAPATIDLAGAEIELVSVVARESRLRKAITALQREVDYVIIDCPPSLGLLTVNALVAAEEMLIPIQCEYYALEGLGQLLRNVELVRSHLNPPLRVSTILLTMYDARTKLAEQVAQEVRSHFGELVLSTTIPRSVRISEAPGYGQSVLTYDPASRGAIAYLEAAREIAERGATAANGGGEA